MRERRGAKDGVSGPAKVKARGQVDACATKKPRAPKAPRGFWLERFAIEGTWYVVLSYPARSTDEQSPLSQAELAVVNAVLRGESTAQIAASRGTAPRTVANQLARAFAKLHVGSRAELAARMRAKSANRQALPTPRP